MNAPITHSQPAIGLDDAARTTRGHYMRTWTGRKFWPVDPDPDEIDILDIAHALSRQVRYNGHLQADVSVAEHSWWCSQYGPDEDALERLMHDAAEAYIGDLIRPVKMIPEIYAVFKPIEDNLDRVIFEKFGLRYPFPFSVKVADEAVCQAEMHQHMLKDDGTSTLHNTTIEAPYKIRGFPGTVAKELFLGRFWELMNKRNIDQVA